ncbi:MAG: tetratricopeptide repeat protein, partial [Pyrinomonadaceae bacterium]
GIPTPPARRARARAIDSLAVLPFLNGSDDPNAEYLSDGITESIINSLAQLPQLCVMARSTVFRYKGREIDPQEVGRAMKVRAVLTGRVLQVAGRLVIRTELVDVADGWQLWGGQYDRKSADILSVQEEISREISAQLRLKLSGEEKRRLAKRHTDSSEAYQTYLKGRYHWNKRTLESIWKGVEYFEQAITLDPRYALAYAGLADSYTLLGAVEYGALPPDEAMRKARTHALKALELDDTLAEAHASLGYVKIFDWDWAGAEREYQRAIALNPNYATARHWYAHFLTAMGRQPEALAEMTRAHELDPLSLPINAGMGWHYFLTRQYEPAVAEYRKTLEMDQNFYLAYFLLGLAYGQLARYEEALAAYERARVLSGGGPAVMAGTARVHALTGRHAEAHAALDQLHDIARLRYVSPYYIAAVYAALGDKQQAFDWLRRACDNHSEGVIWLALDPTLDSLRPDPQFSQLMQRVGLE